MLFSVCEQLSNPTFTGQAQAFLIRDDWDDWFEFKTRFSLVAFDADGSKYNIGEVKIGQFGMPSGQPSPTIPSRFDALGEQFFSLGQDENYYETLNQIKPALQDLIIRGLRDVAADLPLFERTLDERVMRMSLLRFVNPETVRTRFNRLTKGDAKLTNFNFCYDFPSGDTSAPTHLDFEVKPESVPPTNVHVIIGSNGVGKTRCLHRMTQALIEKEPNTATVGKFSLSRIDAQTFSGLVSVSFSAFDPFDPFKSTADYAIGYNYIGLRTNPVQSQTQGVDASKDRQYSVPKDVDQITDDFIKSYSKCRGSVRQGRWEKAIRTLETDNLFMEADLEELLRDGDETELLARGRTIFEGLSSGHKIVLLTITRLIETVDECTLVLMDEPEAHLHPPLLSAFVRALSDLLVQRNGVAIIATHSPVILQEVPKSCAWILRRSGNQVTARRPEIETFGENIGVLTREVFGLEVTHSGFNRLVVEEVRKIKNESGDYEELLARFRSQLGGEARAIARALIWAADSDNE